MGARPLWRRDVHAGVVSRIVSLFSYRCYERRVLLNLAALRAGLCGLVPAWLFHVQQDAFPLSVAIALIPCNAALVALIAADWLERYGRLLIFGYASNIRVSPRGELEGWNGPTHREQEATWRALLDVPIFPDDPGSGRYPPPIVGFWNRVRAIFTGE